MKNSTYGWLVMVCLCLMACQPEKWLGDGQDEIKEDFERLSSLDELLEETSPQWSFFQQKPEQNSLRLIDSFAHTGQKCLELKALAGGSPAANFDVSKNDLANNDLALFAGETVEIVAWYYLVGEEPADFLFLLDLEESVPVGAGPGIRLALDEHQALWIERNKMLEPSLRQPEVIRIPFPRNEWVEVRFRVFLSQKKKGSMKLWQNEVLLFDVEGVQTLPKDEWVYIQGTKGMMQSLQVGITANTDMGAVVLYIDDISLKVE